MAGGGAPLFTFPHWAWRREVLPAAHVVAQPAAAYSGTVRFGESGVELAAAPGATGRIYGRIYGRGNARRWAWLHADLGDGDVCEVVAAVSMLPGLRRLPPLCFVRLRIDGWELPRGAPLWPALRGRAEISRPTWQVSARLPGGDDGERRISIVVTQPPRRTVSMDCTDPNGAPAVCHHTTRADAWILLEQHKRGLFGWDRRWDSLRPWERERCWKLVGTAHAEVGERPAAGPVSG